MRRFLSRSAAAACYCVTHVMPPVGSHGGVDALTLRNELATVPCRYCVTVLNGSFMAKRRKPTSAQSNAARQAAYRQRHLHHVDGQGERINMVITVQAKAQLERLARHYCVTKREILARVLADAERKIVDRLSRGDERTYFKVTE